MNNWNRLVFSPVHCVLLEFWLLFGLCFLLTTYTYNGVKYNFNRGNLLLKYRKAFTNLNNFRQNENTSKNRAKNVIVLFHSTDHASFKSRLCKQTDFGPRETFCFWCPD